jgi:alpha-tubulin suppressor-like RCC1 family protein
MAEVTTNFRDSNNGDLGKNLVSKEYLESVYPKLASSLFTGNLFGSSTSNTAFQGNNDNLTSFSSVRPIFTFCPKSDWVHVALNETPDFTIAINSDGTLWYCGDITPINGNYALRSIPIQYGTLSNWRYASASNRNALLVNSDNTLSVRGLDNGGQVTANYSAYKWKPATDISSVHTNWGTICAIKTDGSLWSWGTNEAYAIGNGNYIPFTHIPITGYSTSSLTRESTGTSQWKKCCVLSGLTLDCTTVLAIKQDGTLWTWGDNKSSSDVNQTITRQYSRLTPVPFPYANTNWLTIPTTISAMDPTSYPTVSVGSHVNYIKQDGTLWSWGDNRSGAYARDNFDSTKPYSPRREFTSSTNWKILDSTSTTLSPCYIFGLKTDGSAWYWGQNYGNYTVGYSFRASPTRYASQLPSTWKQVAIDQTQGGYSSGIVLLRNDNTIWQHNNSHLGYAAPLLNTGNGFTPTQELTLSTNWQSISAGNGHVAAIKTDGSLWSWGGSGTGSGRLGNNTNNSSTIALREATSSTNWKQVSCASFSTIALKTDGTVWGWGSLNNWYGSGNIVRSSPVQEFSSNTNWRLIQACSAGTLTYYVGIKQDGTLWSWGDNSKGQLGNNSAIFASTPVQESSSSTNWNYVLRSYERTTVAVKNDGTLWLWGDNAHSQLGIESGVFLITPTPIFTGTKWIDIHGAKSSTSSTYIGIKDNGTMWTWGTSNPLTQVGTGRSWKTCSIASSSDTINALSTDGRLYVGGITEKYIFLAKGSGASAWTAIRAD